jgi:anti-sigma factor RsiW
MSDYLDAQLSRGRRRRMERHVSGCEECRRVLVGLRALLGALHGMPTPSGGAEAARIAASVRLRLDDPPGPR